MHQGLQGQLNDLNAENWQKTWTAKFLKFGHICNTLLFPLQTSKSTLQLTNFFRTSLFQVKQDNCNDQCWEGYF